jgi:hypothetical protein
MTARQPQPFKTVWWAGIASMIPMAIAVVNQPASKEGAMRLLFLPFPICLAFLGAFLALNVNDNATTLAEAARAEGRSPFGVRFVRLLGLAIAVVSLAMAVTFALGKG